MSTLATRYFALIPAAGVGARMGADGPKQYLSLGGKPMLRHTLDAFLSSDMISHTFVVVSADDAQIDAVAPAHGVSVLRCGGATRMESIQNALAAMAGKVREDDWVLVHDAARPGLIQVVVAIFDAGARSFTRSDSTIRPDASPTITTRQGIVHGSFDSGCALPTPRPSFGSGNLM